MHAIEAKGLTKIYEGSIRAVDGVDLCVEEGEVFGLLGPNGAGKSTTIKMLLTLLKPTSGSIEILGVDALSSPSRVRELVGYVPQEVSVDGDLTGYENLLIFSKFYSSNVKKEKIRGILEYIGLQEKADDLVKNYSGGMMRRLEIAQALVNEPKILFLDEPSIGLDPYVKREVWMLVKTLKEERGMTIFMTTHDMMEAEYFCDRVAIMNAGKIVVLGRPSDLKESVGADVVSLKVSNHVAGLRVPGEVGKLISTNNEELSIVPNGRAEEALPRLILELEKQGVVIHSISISRPTLDDVFLKYTKMRIQEAESLRQARLARRSFRRHAK